MEFGLSDAQKLLVGMVRRFVETELRPLEEEVEATGQLEPAKAKEIFETSKALGLYAMNIPTEFGGGGLSAVDTCLVEEQFGSTKCFWLAMRYRKSAGCYRQCGASAPARSP
jgi:acyl-CoA dehydrogenase